MKSNFTGTIALVTGATNQIGRFLLPRLSASGSPVFAYSRHPPKNNQGIVWQSSDLTTTVLSVTQPSFLFHIAPLPLLPRLLANLPESAPLLRVITFSSTSRFTKADSPDPRERAIADQLTTAETLFIRECTRRQLPWTLFRPTLIYGCGQDKNVTFIANFIRRFGFFPLVGNGIGLRQPVHADDLAVACLQVCQAPTTYYKAYNLSGGQTLSYRDMVVAIFHRLGKSPRILPLPLSLLKLLLSGISWLPTYAHLSPAMLLRVNQDLCFDHTNAARDFGYQPRTFSDNEMGF
ncbi:MAG: hypothetical protein BWK79_18885 [Beggiatoa sp. IS2]|nr:MAG: hypothetical protein BWK79_18885 [Beggiatoa sp. IS2]